MGTPTCKDFGVQEAGYGDGLNEAANLLEGQIKREELKEALFEYLRSE